MMHGGHVDSSFFHTDLRILIVTSVTAEKNAIQAGLGTQEHIDVITVGVGPISSAIETTKWLMQKKYDLVICAGIAGGFATHTSIGAIVISDQIISADLGAESPDGFLSLEDLQLGTTSITPIKSLVYRLQDQLQKVHDNIQVGSILTLATVTGTDKTRFELEQRYPHAVAEAMEGFGVASAADQYHVPSVEIRAISNHIGQRDKSKWRIGEALEQLTKLGSIMLNFTLAWKQNRAEKEADIS